MVLHRSREIITSNEGYYNSYGGEEDFNFHHDIYNFFLFRPHAYLLFIIRGIRCVKTKSNYNYYL